MLVKAHLDSPARETIDPYGGTSAALPKATAHATQLLVDGIDVEGGRPEALIPLQCLFVLLMSKVADDLV